MKKESKMNLIVVNDQSVRQSVGSVVPPPRGT